MQRGDCHLPGFRLLLPIVIGLTWHASAVRAEPVIAEPYDVDCQQQIGYGPYDYRRAPRKQRDLVENPHFHQHYQAYLQGKAQLQLRGRQSSNSTEPPAAGFGYTLMAFPNHPMALAAVEDLGFRGKAERIRSLPLRVHCYFQRAVHIVPNDALVRALYGYYHARRDQKELARVELAKAQELGAGNVNVQMYSAFGYLEIGDLDDAERSAKAAYAGGYRLSGLRQRLEKAGRPLGGTGAAAVEPTDAVPPSGEGSGK